MLLPPRVDIYIAHHLGQLCPNRLLRDRAWHHMRGSYARRVQKKWTKRFGQHRLPHILRAPQGFFVSKWAYEQLRAKAGVTDAINIYGGHLPRILR